MTFVQSIKGAPASVLLALGFTRRPMSHQELQIWTRCGPAQITFALRSLTAAGWVSARTSRGPWSLANGRHVPVALNVDEANDFKSLNNDDGILEHQASDEQTLTTNGHRNQLLTALLEAGIEEPTASELASLPHVTPEYVRAHAAYARAEGLRVGAAIQRIRLAAPAPPPPRSRTDDAAEKIRRFKEGK